MDLPQVGSPSHVPNINDDSLSTSAGDDYTQLDGVEVTFDPGVFTQTVTLNTLTDVPAEGNENLTASLTVSDTRVTVSDSVASVTITESGRFMCCSMDSLTVEDMYTVTPMLSFTTNNVMVGEEEGTVEVCLQLNVPLVSGLDITVTATPGTGRNLTLLCHT